MMVLAFLPFLLVSGLLLIGCPMRCYACIQEMKTSKNVFVKILNAGRAMGWAAATILPILVMTGSIIGVIANS